LYNASEVAGKKIMAQVLELTEIAMKRELLSRKEAENAKYCYYLFDDSAEELYNWLLFYRPLSRWRLRE